MTQKELLYVEDAIGHEDNIIKIVTETINNLENDELKDFMDEKLNEHIAYKIELMNLLEDYANE
ncbi:MAG: hypothetical protein IKO78_00490 [Bacilli bacterium]|nr:hypothetical protein [Bacilli bacterium]